MIKISYQHLIKIVFLPLINASVAGMLLFQGVFAETGRENTQTSANLQTVSVEQPGSFDGEGGLHILESNDQTMIMELVTPEFAVEESTAEGKPCQVLHVQDYGETDTPGYPRLPVKGALVGVPMGPDPSLVVLNAEPTQIDGRFDLCPVENPIIEQDLSGEIRYLGDQAIRDQTAYSLDQYWPSPVAELQSTGFVRSQQIAQVNFHPFQYNPASGELRYYTNIRVQVNLSGAKVISAPSNPSNEGAFEPILSDNLVNYTIARQWRSEAALTRLRELDTPSLGENTYKFLVEQDGIYQVSFADLQAAGIVLTGIDPRTFQVFNQGSETTIIVNGEEDGSFDAGDAILFYGQKVDAKYTGSNVYYLTWGSTTGSRMQVIDGTPADGSTPSSFLNTIHRESNVNYFSNFPSDTDLDVWYWDYVSASSAPASKTYQTSLNNVSTSASETARIRVLLKGHSATPYHHTRVYINDHLVDDATWSSLAERLIDVNIPQTYLLEGANTLKIECPRDGSITKDIVLLNWFEIDYWDTYTVENNRLDFSGNTTGVQKYHLAGFTTSEIEAFDITDPLAPVHISNTMVQSNLDKFDLVFEQNIASEHHYIAVTPSGFLKPSAIVKDEASNLKSTANGADYIVITHKNFYDQIMPLVNWRAASGLRTAVVKVDDIYDEFNNGLVDPSAIHDFLEYAYNNWQRPAPVYVVLVGDGNYDPRNYLGTGEATYIPAYLEQVDLYIGETASDNRYVTVSGSDNLPDLFIGRLPVKTSAEATAVVSKILAYEANMTPESWSDDVEFVTDNADSGGNFPYYSDLVVNGYLPTGYTAQKVYYGVTHTVASDAKTAILNAINEGRLIVNYVGHGSVQSWASESLLSMSSFSSMNNSGKLPFIAALACLTGAFHYPSASGSDNSSIAEKLMRVDQKGAIASWASAGMGLASGQDYLNRGLYQAIFYDGQTQLGVATTQAKIFLSTYMSSQTNLNDIYTLFGDPAMRLKVLQADVQVNLVDQPVAPIHSGDPITYTLSYSNMGSTLATHVILDAQLPSQLTKQKLDSSGANITLRDGSQYTWDVENLTPGQGGTITIKGVMNVEYTSTVEAQANIGSSISDANQTNNFSEVAQTVLLNPSSLTIHNLEANTTLDHIEIYWQIDNPVENLSFNVYRSSASDGEKIRLNNDPIPSLQQGRELENWYTYLDTTIESGSTYYYWVESTDPYQSEFFSLDAITAPYAIYLPTVVR